MLTKGQRSTLAACPDWSAAYEVVLRRHDATGEIIDLGGQIQILGRLRNLGFVEYGMCNDTYRITDAGRRALQSEERDT